MLFALTMFVIGVFAQQPDRPADVKLRYGFAGVKRADLEIESSPYGKVRIEGLPDKAKPMTYEIKKDELKAEVTQDVATTCHAMFDVTLK